MIIAAMFSPELITFKVIDEKKVTITLYIHLKNLFCKFIAILLHVS